MSISGHYPVASGGARRWRVVTKCATHGRQTCVALTFGAQKPREVGLCPPVCPECEHIDAPQACVVSIEAVKADA